MKYIIAICFLAFGLNACNTPTKDEERIDFTKSYEAAAMALTDAQIAYDVAVASNDTTKIAAAKAQLETAKTGYLQSKTYYSANGGVVKDEYEQLLVKTNTSLGKAANDTTTVSPILDLSNTPIATVKKVLDSGAINASKKVQRVSSAISTGEKAVNQSVVKANENLTKARDTTKKRIEDLKKQTNAIKNLFKRPVDTSSKN